MVEFSAILDVIMKRPITDLRNWDQNPRTITKKGTSRLKQQIDTLGQYKPLLAMKDGTILGGNMRLIALRELGIEEVWVSEIDFKYIEDQELWYAEVNGELQPKAFTSKEQGMLEYALSDNDRAGTYNMDQLVTLTTQFDIDHDAYSVDVLDPLTIQQQIDKQGKGDKNMKYEIIIKCTDESDVADKMTKLQSVGIQAKKRGK